MGNQTQLLRIGIVGCGYQGGVLANAAARVQSIQLTACADPDQSAAERVAALVGNVATYASLGAMLQEAAVDAIIVAVPHSALYECALTAIQAGKHVLVEKPIGIDEKEAIQLEEAVARSQICFMSGYSFRHMPAWQKIHALLQAGAVGEIQAISGSIGTRPLSTGWKASPETGGGPLLYIGSHLVDQILWYVGDDPIAVYANVRYRADTRAEETATFQVQFARGVTAQCIVTQKGDSFFNKLEIYGSEGRISLRGAGFSDQVVEVESNALPAYAQPTTIRPRLNDDPRMIKHMAQLAEFVAAIHEGRQPVITVADGRRVLRLLDGVIKSDRRGESIRIG
ncbi:MAG: Gfo/Idh/MocA family oxidoreductase [Chloroflexi bacterium]|nr:Gfo/Idh/MocA family oxidoreductase [Chloroflexota bacterium]